jgi:methylase of polypeptide subunit release factors
VCDPCVGSGSLLLAHAACHPLWLAQIGYVQYSGMDIDPLCVEMCRLNLRLYGVVPLRIEPVTLEALGRLKEQVRPWAAAYEAAVTAPPLQQPALQHAVVEQVN